MKKISTDKKRIVRNRIKLKKVSFGKLRITVSKSLKNISAQIVDDSINKTIVSASSNEKNFKKDKKNKTELSTIVAENLAIKAKEKNITKVYFDRGIYKYHGRVKIFAETLRKNGLEF